MQAFFEKVMIGFLSFTGAAVANIIDLPILQVVITENWIYDLTKVIIGGSVPILIRELIAYLRDRKKMQR
jgi:hypothetical protein